MKRVMLIKTIKQMSMIMLVGGLFAGCAERNLYDPDSKKNNLPSEDSYFGYEMRGDVKLSVNYNAPNFQTIIEVYDQNPILDGVKKKDLKPIYSAYINDGKFEGKMYVPTAITKEVYLYTDNWSLPQCVKMELTKDGAVYDATKASVEGRGVSTRAFFGDKVPYKIAESDGYRSDFLYSLCIWDNNGKPNAGYITQTDNVEKESVANVSARVLKAFDDVTDKSTFLRDAAVTNINIKEENTTLDVVLLAERGEYRNTVGYYYYKTGQEPVESNLREKMQKFIIFPDASLDNNLVLSCGNTAQLLFFGDDGKGIATANFPKGYTIGWFFISNGYENGIIKDGPDGSDFFRSYSNNTGDKRRFVSLNDKQTGIVVLGFEDQRVINGDDDYSDVLFFVKSNKDITQEDRPEIPTEKPEPKPGIFATEGTLLFEDIWPSGGDYDMNDVIVEYKREISYGVNNDVDKMKETFTPVYDGAKLNNFFAYQMKNKTTITPQSGVDYESETNSVIITSSVKEIQNKKYVIERTFNSKINKDAAIKDFNPYIIIGGYVTGGKDRKEVHLPKFLPTSYANDDLNYTEEDAYYIKKDGSYPFAIDIPVLNFKAVAETKRIDDANEYPAFRKWAESKGEKETEWYKK